MDSNAILGCSEAFGARLDQLLRTVFCKCSTAQRPVLSCHVGTCSCAPETSPKVTLDIATYIVEGPIAYAQQYCLPGALSGSGFGCWLPQNDGTFRGSRGRLRVSAIRPLGRCKAGHLSVPCPRKPLETLRATMIVNFSSSCVALPDIKTAPRSRPL